MAAHVLPVSPAIPDGAARSHTCRGCRRLLEETNYRKSRLAARSYLCRRCEGEAQRIKRAFMRDLLRAHRAAQPPPHEAPRPSYDRMSEGGRREILCTRCGAWKEEAAFGRPYADGKTPLARLPCVACKNEKARRWREKQRAIRAAHAEMLAKMAALEEEGAKASLEGTGASEAVGALSQLAFAS